MIQISNDTGFNSVSDVSQARIKQLSKYTNAGIEYQKRNDIHRLALCVQAIHKEKLYLESGHKNIYTYCKEKYNVERGTVSNYINVAKKFLDTNTGKSVFAQGKADFNFLCLIELKGLTVEEVKSLLDDKKINLSSSAKEIKQAVKDLRAYQKEQERLEAEGRKAPIIEAYEAYNKAFNDLNKRIPDSDKESKELMQKIMDCVVILYNENDRLWN